MKWADFFHAGTKLAKLKVLGKPGSWDTAQNAVSQSDYRIFKSTISLDSWKIEVDWKNIGVGMVNFRCDHSILRTLKLAVCQKKKKKKKKKKEIWLLVCWYKFMKAKNYFNNFWVVMVKNSFDL